MAKIILERKVSLRKKLIFLFILIALPAIVFMLTTYWFTRNTTIMQMNLLNQSIVKSSNKLLEHYVKNCQKSLSTLASEKTFRYLVARNDKIKVSENLSRVYKKHKNFNFLAVMKKSREKSYILSSYPEEHKNLLDYPGLKGFLNYSYSHPSENTVSDVFYLGENAILLVYPIKKAIVLAGINIKKLENLLNKIKPMEENRFIVLDSKKNFIIGGSGSLSENFNKTDVSKKIFYRNKENLAFFTVNDELNWTILLSTPKKVLYKSLYYIQATVIILILLGIIITYIIARFFSRMIMLPIANLSEGAKILASGNLKHKIEIRTGDEIEVLANEFNNMSAQLLKSYESLGDKIKNATRDLEAAYSQIEVKNRELQKADKLKSEFLASMSHELRTPINAIIGFTALMEDGTYGEVNERQKVTLHKVIRNTQHLLNLINDILDLSKIEAGRMILHPESFNINLLLRDLISEMKPLADEKGLEIKSDIEKKIECFHDYTRIKQIMMNLISNAIKFTKEGYVKLLAKKAEDNIILRVEDTGIGIKSDQKNRIFDEFVQADGSITREFGGTGLGLGISKKLVKMMRGSLEVESEWGKGSVFTVRIPFRFEERRKEDSI